MAPFFRRLRFLLCAALVAPATAGADTSKQAVLEVPGMNWSLCPLTVKKALARVPGFIDARVDLESKRAIVRYDGKISTPDALAKEVTNAG